MLKQENGDKLIRLLGYDFISVKILARTLLCFFVLLAGRSESPAASAPAKIVLAYASMVARTSFIWIAKDQGFFAKYGIDPDSFS